jgi:Tfp pilus assembly protein PilN
MKTINLVPRNRKPKKDLRLSIIAFTSIYIILLGYLLYSIYITDLNLTLLNADIANTRSEITRLQQYSEFRNDLDRIKSQVENIQTDYKKGRLKESQIMSIIESITPVRLEYDSLEILSTGEVNLKNCEARTYETVAELLRNIKEASLIDRVEISSIVIGKTYEDQEILSLFPDRGEHYVIIGNITTDETFQDAFWFDIKFYINNLS